jgi:hypothetical protein
MQAPTYVNKPGVAVSSSPTLSPDLIRLLKLFLLPALGLVLLLSFFNGYRANNSGEDRSFKVAASDRLFFMNLRSVHYDRETRRDAGMVLFRHEKRKQTKSGLYFFPAILLHPKKEEAYLFFEWEGERLPLSLQVKKGNQVRQIPLALGGNESHKALGEVLWPLLEQGATFTATLDGKEIPLWEGEMEKEVLKTVLSDYFRVLNQARP